MYALTWFLRVRNSAVALLVVWLRVSHEVAIEKLTSVLAGVAQLAGHSLSLSPPPSYFSKIN